MTEETRLNNEIIDEFMFKRFGTCLNIGEEDTRYHESWDWLWFVIDGINGMGKGYHFAIFKTYASMTVEKGGKMYKDFHFAHAEYITPIQSSKEAVYKLILKFVIWDNGIDKLNKQLKAKEDGNTIR